MLTKASPDRTALQQRWFMALAPYDFEVQVIRGSVNAAADALSRLPTFLNNIEVEEEEPPVKLSSRMLRVCAKTDR